MLKQLTIRGLDDELECSLRDLARRTGLSLNRAALLLMRRGARRSEEDSERPIGSGLDDFIGVWTREEAEEFNEAVRVFDQIDEELWK